MLKLIKNKSYEDICEGCFYLDAEKECPTKDNGDTCCWKDAPNESVWYHYEEVPDLKIEAKGSISI